MIPFMNIYSDVYSDRTSGQHVFTMCFLCSKYCYDIRRQPALDKTAWDPLACSLSLLGVRSATTNTKKASLTSFITNSPHSHDLRCLYKKLSLTVPQIMVCSCVLFPYWTLKVFIIRNILFLLLFLHVPSFQHQYLAHSRIL